MSFDIHAGMRVLYKHDGKWAVGELAHGNAAINKKGLFLYIIPKEFIGLTDVPFLHDAEINDIYFDGKPLDQWVKKYPENYMTKEDYIVFMQNEDFDKRTEVAYFTDGEYRYYPISKYTESWIMKQPFDYIVRND
jgi:hypothetical protein